MGFSGRRIKRRRFNKSHRALRPETKFFNVILADTSLGVAFQSVTSASASPTNVSTTIVGIPQGTGEQQRIGRKCTIVAMHFRLNFEFIQASDSTTLVEAATAHETLRYMVIWDRQCNSTAMAATDVLLSGSVTPVAPLYNDYRNLANSKRFRMLRDRIVAFNSTAIGAGNGTSNLSERVVKDYQVNFSLKVFIPLEFDSTTGNIDELVSNNIGFFLMSKHGARMALTASTIRIRFIDY